MRVQVFTSTILFFFLLCTRATSQENILFTKKFEKLVNRYELEFYHPVEKWLKPSPFVLDDFLAYDLVLHSNDKFEVRIIVQGADKHNIIHPHINIVSIISSISSNDDLDLIKVSKMSEDYSKLEYHADDVLFADFVPKESFSHYKKGRLLCLHRADLALVFYLILYENELDPFFNLPIRFKS